MGAHPSAVIEFMRSMGWNANPLLGMRDCYECIVQYVSQPCVHRSHHDVINAFSYSAGDRFHNGLSTCACAPVDLFGVRELGAQQTTFLSDAVNGGILLAAVRIENASMSVGPLLLQSRLFS